ncbi:MAG: DUF1579 domain-containing protein [candidate division Zixibacteria bacterium]|nr:DUF1579 domain-containing protein [candidate division Zixibacteria bacterium]
MDEKQMMERWAQFATPGTEHEEFNKLAGKWDANVKFWMAPGAPPEENTGEAEFTIAMGGRYLIQNFRGQAMGQPFEGMGVTAFDKYRGEYIDTWIDTMGTSVMISRGTAKDGAKHYSCTIDDPMSDRKDVPMRSVASWEGDDTHKLEMYCVAPDGTEFQNMEIVYKRKR